MGLHVRSTREELRLDALSTSRAPTILKGKHAVQAVYEAGIEMAKKPISTEDLVPRMFATLELDRRPIGFMKWQHETIRGATNTSGIIGHDTVDIARLEGATTSSLQISRRADESGLIPFPRFPSLKVRWETFGEMFHIRESYSCFLGALADAATHGVFETDAYVNAVSLSGNVGLNMHAMKDNNDIDPLAWGQLMQTLWLVWHHVVLLHFKSINFSLEHNGVRMAAGFLQLF